MEPSSKWILWQLKMREKSHLKLKYSDETHPMNSKSLPDNQNLFLLSWVRSLYPCSSEITDFQTILTFCPTDFADLWKWKYSNLRQILRISSNMFSDFKSESFSVVSLWQILRISEATGQMRLRCRRLSGQKKTEVFFFCKYFF